MPEVLCLADVFRIQDALANLANATPETRLREAGGEGIIGQMDGLVANLERFGLHRSSALASGVLGPILFDLQVDADDGSETVDSTYLDDLHAAADAVYEAVRREAIQSHMYPIDPSGLPGDFGVRRDLEPALPPAVFEHLGEAQRCWQAGFHLAALFHAFTVTELVTKYYYKWLGGTPRERLPWGTLVKDHLSKKELACPPKLITRLSSLIQRYRNEMIHKGLNLDTGRAQVIYGKCAQCSRDMIDDLWIRDLLHKPPTDEQIDTMLYTMDILQKKADQAAFVSLLSGEPCAKVEGEGWNCLQTHGAFRDLPKGDVWYKVDCMLSGGLFRRDSKQALEFADELGPIRARQLVIDSMFAWANQVLIGDSLDGAFPRFCIVRDATKQAFLDEVVRRGIVEYLPVLDEWQKRETQDMGEHIRVALQSLRS